MLKFGSFAKGATLYTPLGGQSFRKEYLWRLSVDDLLKANESAIDEHKKYII